MHFTRGHIWLTGLVFSTFTTLVTLGTVALSFPPETWSAAEIFGRQLLLAAVLPPILTFPLTCLLGWFIFRNGRINANLQRLLYRDRLTDAATRDCFFDQMADAPDTAGVALVVDIDHFKRVNDTFGHLVGDYVIQRVARIIQESVKADDIVCRFGGEEFVVFLKDGSPERGAAVAERIRALVESALIFEESERIRVTVSIGGARKEPSRDIEDCIRIADMALYRAKEAGRNAISLSWLPVPEDALAPSRNLVSRLSVAATAGSS